MKTKLTLLSMLFALALSAQQSPIKIAQAVLDDEVTISFKDRAGDIKPHQNFWLSDYSLTYANDPDGQPFYITTECLKNNLNDYQDSRIKTYDITIKRPGTKSLYYGKIAFFAAKAEASSEATVRNYQISIPSNRFDAAGNGTLAICMEYYTVKGKNYPTWVIWFTDQNVLSNHKSEMLRRVGQDMSKKRLRSGIACTVVGGVFLASGAGMVAYGVQNMTMISPYYGTTEINPLGISMLGVGATLLAISIPLVIVGPIKIATAKRRKGAMELCFSPRFNLVTGSSALDMKLQF